MDFKQTAKNEITRAFMLEFRTLLKQVQYIRQATNGSFNPITEVYTGGTNGLDLPVVGIFRKISFKKLQRLTTQQNINVEDRAFTFLKDNYTFDPKPDDVLDGQWKVITSDTDPTETLCTVYIRRV